ncbi:MAG TPA: hypothetical protein VIC28_18140 [Thermoanaerobaculia bacterium]|jgi:hypothetical protein
MEPNDRTHGSPADLDRRLRGALEPPPEAVARIVGAALAGGSDAARGFRLIPVASALAVLMAAAALLLMAPWPPPGISPGGEPLPASISIENVGEVLILRARDGRRSLVHHRAPGEEASPSSSMIVLYGD